MESSFQPWLLIPDFSLLFSDVTSAAGFSAHVVFILLVVFVLFLVYSVLGALDARRHTAFLLNLVRQASGGALINHRRDMLKTAEDQGDLGKLWREFDESLVASSDGSSLFNTLDAAHFFNTRTLASRLTENRLIAAAPGLLTAIGVLGTFAGLQMGLAGLSGDASETLNTEALRDGIFAMIGGASIAFLTSVWGILASFIFNFIEKLLERNVRAKIAELQKEIDFNFPRITAELTLHNIEDISRNSGVVLAEMAEKIGDKMQEAMMESSQRISATLEEALANALGPAIEKIAADASSGSEKALTGLVDRFMSGMSEAGTQQRQLMDKAATDMHAATMDMSKSLNHFNESIEGQVKTMVERNEASVSAISEKLIAQASASNAQQQNVLDKFSSSVADQMERNQQAASNHAELIERLISDSATNQEALSSSFEKLLSSLSEVTLAQQSSAELMKHSSTDMKTTSNQLGILSGNLKDANGVLSQNLQDCVETVKLLSSQFNQLAIENQSHQQKQRELVEVISGSASTMASATSLAESGYESVRKHFGEVSSALERHVQQLEVQVAQLLEQYGQKVNVQVAERMDEWNKQTIDYVANMTDAIQAISAVVDELESKTGR